MVLLKEIEHAEEVPVDFAFIKSVVKPIIPKIHMIAHEDLPEKPDLDHDVFKGSDAVAILFRVFHSNLPTDVAHWCCLMKASHGKKVRFYDSLALNLKRIYALTSESPKLLWALRNTSYEDSHTKMQDMVRKQKYCGTAVSCRLRYPYMSNREFERHILSYDRSHPGRTMTLMTLFHYFDQKEYSKKYLEKVK